MFLWMVDLVQYVKQSVCFLFWGGFLSYFQKVGPLIKMGSGKLTFWGNWFWKNDSVLNLLTVIVSAWSVVSWFTVTQ